MHALGLGSVEDGWRMIRYCSRLYMERNKFYLVILALFVLSITVADK
jgi:hypothetical protein